MQNAFRGVCLGIDDPPSEDGCPEHRKERDMTSTQDPSVKMLLQRMLVELAHKHPALSKRLTTAVDRQGTKGREERKLAKAQLLHRDHRSVFDEILAGINRADSPDPNQLGIQSLSIFTSIFEHTHQVSGSYGSKYGHGQGPIK
jgi:hypothetical protein